MADIGKADRLWQRSLPYSYTYFRAWDLDAILTPALLRVETIPMMQYRKLIIHLELSGIIQLWLCLLCLRTAHPLL